MNLSVELPPTWPGVSPSIPRLTSLSHGGGCGGSGSEVSLPPGFLEVNRAFLSDPQTSGGLLVACSPACAAEVLALFHAQGFAEATVIASMAKGAGLQVY